MKKEIWIAQSMRHDTHTNRFEFSNDIEALTSNKALNNYIANRTENYNGSNAISNVRREDTNAKNFVIEYNYSWIRNDSTTIIPIPVVTKCRLVFKKIQLNEGR